MNKVDAENIIKNNRVVRACVMEFCGVRVNAVDVLYKGREIRFYRRSDNGELETDRQRRVISHPSRSWADRSQH